jgi:hypothetical protein
VRRLGGKVVCVEVGPNTAKYSSLTVNCPMFPMLAAGCRMSQRIIIALSLLSFANLALAWLSCNIFYACLGMHASKHKPT